MAYLLILFFCTIFTGCKPDEEDVAPVGGDVEDPLSPAPDVRTTLSGIVLDEEGNPLAGVTVTAHGETTTTSAEGLFELENIQVPGNRCVISCEKENYFTGTRAEIPLRNAVTSVRIRLMSSATTHTIDAASGGTATLSNGSKVEIPANGLVTESGASYTGEVNMSVRYLDPSAISFGALVAGGDMLARRTDESTSILYSYGILRVLLSGSAGEKLQLATGKASTLTVAIPQSQLTTAPQTIPLWYFDEAEGVWIEEGVATRQGDKYIGTVSHFTDWNCDDPKEFATVIGRVVDCNGGHITRGEVFIGQSSNDLNNGVVLQNPDNGAAEGRFSMRVPVGMALMVVVPPPAVPITASTERPHWVMVPVPPLAAEQVYDVGDIRPHPCPSVASGSFKLKTGDAVKSLNVKVLSGGTNNNLYKGSTPVPYSGTNFSMNFLAADVTYSMTITTESGLVVTKVFQTNAAGETVDLGVIDLTGPQLVTISGMAICQNTPLENAAVTVSWAGGSASATTDNLGLFAISMPVGTSGTASITHTRGAATKTFQSPASGDFNMGPVDLCASQTATGENSFLINGDGYQQVKKALSIKPYPDSYVYFNRDEATTKLSVVDASDAIGVTLSFLGTTPGVAGKNDETGAVIWMKSGNKTINYWAGYGMSDTNVDITITRYDTVGGLIEGTFTGTFVGDNGSTVTITDGKFSGVRYFDFSGLECRGFCM